MDLDDDELKATLELRRKKKENKEEDFEKQTKADKNILRHLALGKIEDKKEVNYVMDDDINETYITLNKEKQTIRNVDGISKSEFKYVVDKMKELGWDTDIKDTYEDVVEKYGIVEDKEEDLPYTDFRVKGKSVLHYESDDKWIHIRKDMTLDELFPILRKIGWKV